MIDKEDLKELMKELIEGTSNNATLNTLTFIKYGIKFIQETTVDVGNGSVRHLNFDEGLVLFDKYLESTIESLEKKNK